MRLDPERVGPEQLESLGWNYDGRVWTHPVTPGQFDTDTAIEVTKRAFAGYTANKDEDWTPSQMDIQWQENHCAKISYGGMWETSECRFRIFNSEQLAVLISGNPAVGLAERIIRVFKEMNWNVVVMQGESRGKEEDEQETTG